MLENTEVNVLLMTEALNQCRVKKNVSRVDQHSDKQPRTLTEQGRSQSQNNRTNKCKSVKVNKYKPICLSNVCSKIINKCYVFNRMEKSHSK